MRFLQVLLVVVCLLLASCHTMNMEDCQSADWYQVGYHEGMAEENDIAAHQKACARFSITPDKQAYHRGRRAGFDTFLKNYCSAANGYRLGRKDANYREICPPELVDIFLQNYHEGYHDYKMAYCTANNGYKLGKNGEGYKDICPPHRAQAFLRAYHQGYEIYKLKLEIKKLNQEADAREQEIANLRHKQLTDETRYEIDVLLDELDDLRYERARLMRALQ